MQSGLIDKSGNKIDIPYYEIGDYSKHLVLDYIKQNEKNKNEFEHFKENYKDFEPYFDFLILHMGYAIINPFMEKGILFENDNNFAYLNKTNEVSKNTPYELYPKANTIDFEIKKTNFIGYDAMVLPNNNFFEVDRTRGFSHELYLRILFMENAIKSKRLYEVFIDSHEDIYYFFIY